ncbi:sister chromatid cohesion protein PDS5 homolog D-like isoform X1 [Pyrus communis]|uniref:sister chromatid cohesion protein PDS5 homolog D-like isoform X1 n=1 Tax=Pyrus communis TaxID=23211 RepID=UPI0035BEEADA
MSCSSEKELEEQLKEAGNILLNPPSATEELLKFLGEAEGLLSNVEQAPHRSMQDALLPIMKALISDELFRHSDVDVKLYVASCITELTRITAPVPPYNDEWMKEIFQLTVAAFEKLSYVSSPFYRKAVSILHIVAKVRSSLLMLDLGCSALILKMFQHFLKLTQSNHPHSVFSAMETIMTMVLDESEEIPVDLVKALLSSVRKENQTVSHFSWKLGEKVIDSSSAKLKPYLVEAVKSMDTALDDYAQIVASICQNGCQAVKHDHVNDSVKILVTEGPKAIAVCPREVEKTVAASTEDEHIRHKNSTARLQHCHRTKPSKVVDSRDSAKPDNSSSEAIKSATEPCSAPKKRGQKSKSLKGSEEGYDNAQPNNSLSLNAVKSEIEPSSAPKKRGRKPNSLMNPAEGYDHSWISSGRKTQKPSASGKSDYKVSNPSPTNDLLHAKADVPLMLKNVREPPGSKPKTERDVGASLFLPNNPLGGSQHIRRRLKKKDVADHAADPSSLSAVKQEFSIAQIEERTPQEEKPEPRKKYKGTVNIGEKLREQLRDVRLAEKSNEGCIRSSVNVVTDKESEVPSDPDKASQQQSSLDVETKSTTDPSSVHRRIKKSRGNYASQKESAEASGSKISESAKKMNEDNEGTPKVVLKRKRIIEKEEASQMPDLGERLVDRRIKVWWPQDKKFYEGVVSSYDPAKKKHLVLYADGDEENLNLKKQRWKLIGDDLPDVELENLIKPFAASDTLPQKRKQKPKSGPSKQTNTGLSSKRISRRGVSAGSKSADCFVLGGHKVTEECDGDQTKENDGLKDDGQISAGKLEANMKTGIGSATVGEHKVIDEREDDQVKENDGVKDNGQISVGKLEANMKTGIDSATVGEHKVIDECEGEQAKENDGLKDNGQISAGAVQANMKTGIDSATVGEHKVIDEREGDQAMENDGLKDNGQMSAGKSKADMKAGIDSAAVGDHKVIDEREGGQAKENAGLKDNGQMYAGELEAGMKTGIDSAQLTPETMTLSKGESPKVDIEPSGRECFKELMELGKGAENARSLNVS